MPDAGPPRYVPPPPRSRSARLLRWGVGVLAVLAVVVLVLVLVLRGGQAPAQSPREATQRFVEALDGGDCDALTPLVSTRLAEILDCGSASEMTTAIAGIGALNVSFGAIDVLEESDDRARTTVEVMIMSFDGAVGMALIREDGGWVVDDYDVEGSRIPLPGFP